MFSLAGLERPSKESGDRNALPEVCLSMMQWLRTRSLPTRVFMFTAAAILAFALAAGMGAIGTLMLRDELVSPGGEAPRPPDEQGNAARPQEMADYVSEVGEIQGNAVEISLASHDKLLRYDILTTDDLEELRANEAALGEFADQVDNLDPPEEYADQYEAFRSAIRELHVAARLAYEVVADPTAATKSKFDAYDRHLAEADGLLQESNERLGRDYETIGGVQEISPL
jgi:hypothetical protein